MTTRILTVCTGNICRSPQAEQLLRAGFEHLVTSGSLREAPEVASAGTHARPGSTMPSRAAALSSEFGGNPTGHLAKLLTKDSIESADLILALSREHRSAIAKLSPRAAQRTFTLRELERILDASAKSDNVGQTGTATSLDPLRAVVAYAARSRVGQLVHPELDDVVDPYLQSDDVYGRSIAQIVPAVDAIVRAVARSSNQ